jgi:hypothetical protein
MSKQFLGSYRNVLERLKGSKEKLRAYREQRRPGREERRAEREYNRATAGIPAEYLEKYGSNAGDMWRREQLIQRATSSAVQNIYNQAGATPADVQKYGSDAADIARARNLNQSALQAAQERFQIGIPTDRSAAVQESLKQAQSASQGFKTPEAIRDFYTKSFASKGDNPNVFGMKDLEHLENTGTSADDIRRIALTINRAGPLAAKRLAEKYGVRDPRFNY